MKRSAGVLLWKKENNKYFILLTHFGGPYWRKYDVGAWSIQKGLVEEKEKVYDAAKRESFEETNLSLVNDISYLATRKVSKKKLVIMFESYFDGDISSFQSNYFQLEWPVKSGNYQEFPEMDKIKWFSFQDAKKFIHPTQVFFINRLERKIILDMEGELNE